LVANIESRPPEIREMALRGSDIVMFATIYKGAIF